VASDVSEPPAAGDVVWVDFGTPVGREQGGRRPALVLTSHSYNSVSSTLLVCPITTKRRDWPFEVRLPDGGWPSGVVLVDQVRVVDPNIRPFRRAGRVENDILSDVRAKLASLLGIPVPI
jgi:mRNA interferase MazF